MSEGTLNVDCNVRSSSYFVALTTAECVHCRAATRLIALVLPPAHQIIAADALDERPEESAEDTWEAAHCSASLSYIGYLAESVQRRLREIAPAYRLAHGTATQGSYWANHCERCDALLHDHDLHCEPEGAFLPTNPESAAAIRLIRMDEPFEAAAAGYAYEPPFLPSLRET